MTYNEFIQNILDTRGRFIENYDGVKERHHIKMRSLGGTNDEDNLIDLIDSEHYEAHKLLALENPDCKEAQYAWDMMCRRNKDGMLTNTITASEWEEARRRWRNAFSGENHPMYNKHHTEETRRKISEAGTGKKRTEETKQNISRALMGHTVTDEARAKMSAAKKGKYVGENNIWFGKHLPDEVKKKLSESHKGLQAGGKNVKAKKCVCDNVIYDCVTDCANIYDVKPDTMMVWLRKDKIPTKFKELGLAYYKE